jgi:hypothetical protein
LTGKLYAEELLKKITSEEELRVLEAIWDEDLSLEAKIDLLLKEDKKCSNSK